jgi:prolyl 4-hydroxylase
MVEPRSILAQADELARAGRPDQAVRFVEQAAAAGNPEAQLEVAQWRLFGLYGGRDHPQAMLLLARARDAGYTSAARLEAALMANGAAGPSNPARARQLLEAIAPTDDHARRQLDLVAAMPALAEAGNLPSELLCADPPIRLVRGLASPSEAEYLIARAEPRLQPSFVVDPLSGRRVPHPTRKSSGTNFGPADEDLVINSLNRRIAAATGTAFEAGEPLHMLRYVPGDEYRPHVDAIAGLSNQRDWTVLLYLSEGYSGGETAFPELDVAVRGAVGDALIFRNTLATGEPDSRTRHAGRPVTAGVKWLASRWIRRRAFSVWDQA